MNGQISAPSQTPQDSGRSRVCAACDPLWAEAEARHRALLEAAHDAIILADADSGVILDANRQAGRLLGLPVERIIGLHQTGIHPPDEAGRYREVFTNLAAGGGLASGRLFVRHSSGRDIPVEIGSSTIQLGARRVVYGVFRDITERLLSEEALRLQSAALESAGNGVVITDRRGEIAWVNPAFTRLTGYTQDEVAGRNANILKSGRHPPEFYAALWRTVLNGQVWESEITNRRKDGTLYTQDIIITPVRDPRGTITHFIAIQQDITQRKRMEVELRESQQRFEHIFKSNPGAITIHAASDFRLLDANDSFLEPLGYTREEVIGRTPAELGLVADAAEGERLREALRRDGRLRNFEIRFRGRTGQILDVLMTVEPVQLGSEPCLLATANDITRWKQQQQELEEQLRRAQKLESVGTLAGGVAHDFNNILTVIQGHAHLLLGDSSRSAADQESVRQIVDAAERAANLTRQLLTFSRRQPMQRRALDLNEVVGNMTRMLRRIIGEDIQLEIKCPARVPLVMADTGMIEQVLMNLAVNSRDAIHVRSSSAEPGRLVIGTEAATVMPSGGRDPLVRPLGEYVCLSVQDNGCGIPPEIRDRIYDPFFTTKDVGKGTGLGLATVHGIVAEHGGWIDLDSGVNAGTTFRIYLPACRQDEASPAHLKKAAPVRGGHETILLVEDETGLRDLAKEVLTRYGYHVISAHSGRHALEVWDQHQGQFDLLLTDIIMPEGLDGCQLAQQLEARKPDLKVIYTTGYSPDIVGWDFHFLRGDGIHFLQKPYPPQELAKVVRDCLDGHVK